MNLVCPLCGVSVQGEKAQVVSTTHLCRGYDGDALWNDVLLTLETNHTLVLYGGGGKKTACDFVACGDELLSDKDEKLPAQGKGASAGAK